MKLYKKDIRKHNLKKIFLSALIILTLVSCQTDGGKPIVQNPEISSEAMVRDMGIGINIGNTLD